MCSPDLQQLQALTEVFVKAIIASTRRMSYGMRFIARETLNALRARFPNHPPSVYAAALGDLIFHRYLKPAILLVPSCFKGHHHSTHGY